jgi:hypothetical protein
VRMGKRPVYRSSRAFLPVPHLQQPDMKIDNDIRILTAW